MLGVANGKEMAEHGDTWREIAEAAMGLNGQEKNQKKRKFGFHEYSPNDGFSLARIDAYMPLSLSLSGPRWLLAG